MFKGQNVIVLGLGEVGKPILELVSKHHKTTGIDIAPPSAPVEDVDVMHVCYPFEIRDFIGETVRYIQQFRPKLAIINSTVGVGTTRAISERTGRAVVNSPVRGKHAHMVQDMLKYTKFVGAMNLVDAQYAAGHFASIGMMTKVLSSPEATELAKLTETTYFGVLIAWAQEVERFCDQVGADYHEVSSFYEEVGFFPPVKYFPGIIGGHCVMPNIEILSRSVDSEILKAIQASNKKKMEREANALPRLSVSA